MEEAEETTAARHFAAHVTVLPERGSKEAMRQGSKDAAEAVACNTM